MTMVIETTVANGRLVFAVIILAVSLVLSNAANGQAQAETTDTTQAKVPEALLGDWSLQLDNDLPAWMSIGEEDGTPIARMRLYVGGVGPYKNATVENGRVKFSIVKKFKKNANKKKRGSVTLVNVGIKDGKLDGSLEKQVGGKQGKQVTFTGTKIPPMTTKTPDLAKVKFGPRVTLFNGKDLTGWTPREKDKKMGWSVVDGLLQNDTPKTDFSATGAYANLKTTDNFEDLTLVDRHITAVLNGETVVNNQPVPQPTAGAIHTNPSIAGPIYLQGDHTSVAYRNIYLEPVFKE